MIDLGAYKDKFGDSGQRILENALNESRRRDQNYVAVEHILKALTDEEAELFNSTMRDLAVDPHSVRLMVEKRLEMSRQHVGKGFRIAPDTTDLFKRAMERARAQGRKTIESTDIFTALSQDERGLFVEVMRGLGASPEAVVENGRARVHMGEQEEEQYKKKLEFPLYLKHFGVSLNRLARMDRFRRPLGASWR